MYGGPAAAAGLDAQREEEEEQEEAGHAEAQLVDGRVTHQSTAVLPRMQLLTHLAVVRDL